MKKPLLFFISFFITPSLYSEIAFKDAFSIPMTLKGYVKHESFIDSRQVVGAGENQVLIFPAPVKLDDFCCDVNNRGSLDSVPIQTRLRLDIDGPEIGSAKSYGTVEAHFFGRRSINNIMSLRHAYLHLVWDNLELMAGQYWHPMFSTDAEVRTISFNTGLPIEPFSRNPQIRFQYKRKAFDLLISAVSQLGFSSDGPIGFSSTYLRNAVIPNMNLRLEGHLRKHILGGCIDYLRIVPRLETNTGLKANESLNSVRATGYTALKWDNLEVNNKIIFAQNGTDLSLLGGYAVHTIDPTTDKRTYTNINTISLWTDWQFRPHQPVKFGFFFGFLKNLGSFSTVEQNLTDTDCNVIEERIFGGGTDIDNILRFAPRVTWTIEDFEFAAEIEYTRATFGCLTDKAKVVNTTPSGNTRLLIALFYFI